jgi:hypothetical protein
MSSHFPDIMPETKPNRPLSAAMNRLYDQFNPLDDLGNEFYTHFKYSKVTGLGPEKMVSRRDPSNIIRVNGVYYTYYTCRKTPDPVGRDKCTDELPGADWDLADIWYATSTNGVDWIEQGIAVPRAPKGTCGDRSLATPQVMAEGGKYYLYYQAYTGRFGYRTPEQLADLMQPHHGFEVKNLHPDVCCASMAWADSPEGPWTRLDKPLIEPGTRDEWDGAIHDPTPIKFKGKYYIYYKATPLIKTERNSLIMMGCAISDSPMGPFVKPLENPVLLGGHETFFYPYRDGIACVQIYDGPEKNTVQFSKDGINFEVKAHVMLPPVGAGPFCPDMFADNGDGQGVTWGVCHMFSEEPGYSCYIARFDCALSQKVNRPELKRYLLRFDENTYFQKKFLLSGKQREQYLEDMKQTDTDML